MCQGAPDNLISINKFWLRYIDYVRSPHSSIICLLFIRSGIYKAITMNGKWAILLACLEVQSVRFGEFLPESLKSIDYPERIKALQRKECYFILSSSLPELESCIWIWRIRFIRSSLIGLCIWQRVDLSHFSWSLVARIDLPNNYCDHFVCLS